MEQLVILQLKLLRWKVLLYRAKTDNLLAKNGGTIVISKHWAHYIMAQTNVVKRHGNTKSKVTCTNFEEIREQFILVIKTIIAFEEIPDDLILNWGHTEINYVHVSSLIIARESFKKMESTGIMTRNKLHMFQA